MNDTGKKMMIRRLILYLFLSAILGLNAQVISIGSGNALHQGLPIEPLARFSYTQELYYGSDIGIPGEITALGFEYNVQSSLFYQGNKEWQIYLGHSNLNSMQDWIPVAELSLVYDGILAQNFFDAGLPGSGWLTIPLQESFMYDGVSNLVIAVDENTDGGGSSSDDFFCTELTTVRALNFQSMSENPDPANPPATIYPKTALANLRLHFSGSVAPDAPRNLYGYYAEEAIQLFWSAPLEAEVLSYIINRNTELYAETSNLHYSDADVTAGTVYTYNVQATYPGGVISPASNTIQIEVPQGAEDTFLYESFEECAAFSQDIPGFINLDNDGAQTWNWANVDFPGEGSALGWMVFAPALTTPPLEDVSAATGSQMLMSASAMTPPNDDWLILPNLRPGASSKLSFQARSFTAAYGLERLRVMLSSSDSALDSFVPLHAEDWLAIPATWSEYEFDLSQYAAQDLYLALNCVSLDAFALFVDDISVSGVGGELGHHELVPPSFRPYPNPSKGDFRLKSEGYFDLTLYNLRGQKLSSARGIKEFDSSSLRLTAGIYLLKVVQDGKSQTFRQVILP
jgi:hypothetical protein